MKYSTVRTIEHEYENYETGKLILQRLKNSCSLLIDSQLILQ